MNIKHLLFLILFYSSNLFSQSINDFVGTKWEFNFLMKPNNKKSITSLYHATYFEIDSENTFSKGMSEAMETGVINADSTLKITLYDYNSDAENQRWSESFKIIHYSQNFLILEQKNANYKHYLKDKNDEIGPLWLVYSKNFMGVVKKKEIYKQIVSEFNLPQ